ncbi:Pectate lyase [Rhodopirellula islandica]|uniref:Pectate lyase n=2 Tax=Rhodopirellula islandica TaxID=595434 RepID=A0A0J1B960_RHOIS|nr:Pectate lyase [Rhodopirellula islandica]
MLGYNRCFVGDRSSLAGPGEFLIGFEIQLSVWMKWQLALIVVVSLGCLLWEPFEEDRHQSELDGVSWVSDQDDVSPCGVFSDLKAFPGAQGFGATTAGGRGGAVLTVENLNDSGRGSLREAVETKGARFVVFSVSGTIELETPLKITEPNITIAGHSAPGGGIALKNSDSNTGPSFVVNASEVVIRYLRVRPGLAAPSTSVDAISILGGKNIVIANNSFSWAVDENVNLWFDATDVTVQHNIISEGIWDGNHTQRGLHSKGLLSGLENVRVSVHHNLFAHNDDRNPRLTGLGKNEVVNNVIYNYYQVGTNFSIGVGFQANLIGNVFLPGKQHREHRYPIVVGGQLVEKAIFVRDNLSPRRSTGTEDEWLNVGFNGVMGDGAYNGTLLDESVRAGTPFEMSAVPVTLEPAETLVERLLPIVGATLPRRDAVDVRVVSDVRNKTGVMINDPAEVGGWPALEPGTVQDRDRDGMPDAWELQHGLDPDDSSDAMQDMNGDGYVNLEQYLECLVFEEISRRKFTRPTQ